MVQARVPVGCRVRPPRGTSTPGLELTRVAAVTTRKDRISRPYFSIIIISIIITMPPANSRRSNTPLMPSIPSTAWTLSNSRWCIKNCRIISKVFSRTLLPRATNWIWCCSLAQRIRLRVLRCCISKLKGGISSRWIIPITMVNPSVLNAARYIQIILIWSNTFTTFTPCRPNTSRVMCAASNSRPSNIYRFTCFPCTVSESERVILCIRCKHICKLNSNLLCSLLRKFPRVNNNNNIPRRKDGLKTSSDLEITQSKEIDFNLYMYAKNPEETFWRQGTLDDLW